MRKIQTSEGLLSYSFGQLLYEMVMCRPLNAAVMESAPPDMAAAIRPVVETLLTKDAIKKPLPTINDLIATELFSSVRIDGVEKPTLKVPSRLKEEIQKCRVAMESRLQAEQKKVQQQKRLQKAQENLMSEEEKKKRRKLQKKQLSQQDDSSFASYPTTEIRTERAPAKAMAPAPKRSSSKSQITKQASTTKQPAASNATGKPPPPPAAPPPPVPAATAPPPKASSERGALLGSIHSFSKTKLKKTVTNDRSAPKI